MKYRIGIKNSECQIKPKPDRMIEAKLTHMLSYKKKNSQFTAFPMVYLYRPRTAIFPIGFLPDVIKILGDVETVDLNKHVETDVKFGRPKFDMREYQAIACAKWLKNKRGIIALATGLGKTLTAMWAIKRVQRRTLIIVHTVDLFNQWCDNIEKHLDVIPGHIRGSKKECKDISVTTIQTLQKNKDLLKNFDMLVIDEMHHCSSDSYYKLGLKAFTQKYMLSLSATPTREDGHEMKFFGLIGPILDYKSTKWGIDNGYLCPPKITMLDVPYRKYSIGTEYNDVVEDYIINNVDRTKLLLDRLKEYSDKKTLILVSRIEHGEMLLKLIKNEISEDVTFLHGSVKNRDTTPQFIIATNIFDEGVDLPDIEHVVIAGGGKSSIKTVQRLGRGLRIKDGKDYVIVTDFNDNCKFLKSHANLRAEIYEGLK